MGGVVNGIFTKRQDALLKDVLDDWWQGINYAVRETSPLSLVPLPQLRKHSKRQRNRRQKRWNSTHNPRRTKSHCRHVSLPFFPTIMLFMPVKSQVYKTV